MECKEEKIMRESELTPKKSGQVSKWLNIHIIEIYKQEEREEQEK